MNDRLLMITPPDDSHIEGVRIFLFDLTRDHYSIFSKAIFEIEQTPSVIIYNSNISTPSEWIIDKLLKSDLIFFNAESEKQQYVGYLCSKMNSYYFGNLRDLFLVNSSVVCGEQYIKQILESQFKKYGKL